MKSVLDMIQHPRYLKKLSLAQLEVLAEDIRKLIIETVAKNGGHLAPSLGVVDITVALHAVFNFPEDKVVWDVGHQAYGHKILTGRRDVFHTLRQYDGITGFPNRSESEYDAFGVGHSSTSISAALGMALARDLNKKENYVVAVIGDGALTGGEAFEALNNAGDLRRHLIVILNDNEMSIDKNVGAMSDYLSRIRTAPTYTKAKRDIEELLKKIPAIGDSVVKTLEHVKDSVRYLLLPGGLFEELGFTYVGPIDGHNIELMMDVLDKAMDMEGPILIHMITKKGKGYLPAELEPDLFHGVGPFCAETGKIFKNTSTIPTYTNVFSDAMIDLAKDDDSIVAITAAMPAGTGLKKFGDLYPGRFFDVGIAEQHAVTLAAGMATGGKTPVIALYSTFAQRAYDQILHDVCLQNLSVVIALDRAGLVGEDGPTHHGVFDYSYLRHMPNLVMMAPKDENELRQMMATAVKLNKPVILRYPRGAGFGVAIDDKFTPLPLGKAEILSTGSDIVFIGAGVMTDACSKAAEILNGQGMSCGVINTRFIKPLDVEAICQAARSAKIVITVEDNVLAGGFGSAVMESINEAQIYNTKVLRLGFADQFVEQGTRKQLLDKYGLTAEKIAVRAYEFFKMNRGEWYGERKVRCAAR